MKTLKLKPQRWRNDAFAVPMGPARRTGGRTAGRSEQRRRGPRRFLRFQGPPCGARRVCLEFHHALAHKVEIAGSFNDWRPGATWMISLGQGRWVKELVLPPGRYEYSFVVDGRWMPDPRAWESAPGQRGRYHSVLTVPPPNGDAHSRTFVLQPQ